MPDWSEGLLLLDPFQRLEVELLKLRTFCCLYALLEMFSFNQEYSHFFAKRYNLLRKGASWGMKLLRLCECWLYICINWLRLCKSFEVVSNSNRFFLFLWKVCNFLIQLLLSHLTEKLEVEVLHFEPLLLSYEIAAVGWEYVHVAENSWNWLRIHGLYWQHFTWRPN